MPYKVQTIYSFTCAECGPDKVKKPEDKWLVFRDDTKFFAFTHWSEKLAVTDKWDSACSIECVTKRAAVWSAANCTSN